MFEAQMHRIPFFRVRVDCRGLSVSSVKLQKYLRGRGVRI